MPCSYSCACLSEMCLFWIGLGRFVSTFAFDNLSKLAAWKCFLAVPVALPWRGPLWVEFYFTFHVKLLQIIKVGFLYLQCKGGNSYVGITWAS